MLDRRRRRTTEPRVLLSGAALAAVLIAAGPVGEQNRVAVVGLLLLLGVAARLSLTWGPTACDRVVSRRAAPRA